MKKILSFVLIVALVSALFTLWTSAAETPAAMTGASVTAEPGETVAVDVTLENNPGFMYMHVFVSVDEGLEIVSIDNNSAAVKPDGMTFGATTVTGGYNVTADHSENITGDGVFFTVNVKVGENASGTLNVNLAEGKNGIFNYDEDEVAFEFTAGEVEVEAGPEEPALVHCNMDIFQVTADILSVQGWAGANYPANNLGYKVDGGDPIFDGIEFRNFNTEAEGETIKGIAGEFAFRFASAAAGISLADVEAGEHTITLVVRVTVGADNAVVDMASKTFTISHEVPDPSLHAFSFDNIFIEGVNKTPAGNAGGWIAENENFGDVQNIGVRGWAWVDNGHIGQFGYQIDDADPVFSAAYLENRADIGGILGTTMDICNGFQINPIDVSGLADGAHVFKILLTSDNDTVLTVTSFSFTVERPEPPVEYSLLNVSYDELKYDDNTLVNGSADKWIHNLEDPSVLDFQVGTVSNITVRGWVRISEDVADIAGFGYSIDGGAVVEGDFIQDRAAELAAATFPGAQGFCIVVPVSDLAVGEHSIDAYVIAADGTEIKIVKDRSTEEVQDIRQVGVTFNVTEEELPPQPAALHAMSFNTVWVDGNLVCDVPDALGYLGENPITGDVQTIGVRGWAWIDNSTIEAFGYKLDGGEPVFDAAYTEDRPDVYAQPGAAQATANGFNIQNIDVSALETGDHTITALVKAADGTIIEVVTAPFSVERPAPQDPVALHGYSFDTLWLDYNLMVDGGAGAWIEANPNFGCISLVSVRGWAWIDNGTIESFGYSIDDSEPVFDAAYIQDRSEIIPILNAESTAVCNGFFINPIVVGGLSAGDHTIRLYVKATDGSVVEITSFSFTLEKAIWLCDASTGVNIPGAWMTDVSHYIDVDFDAPVAFKGFCAMFYANAQGVEVEIRLIDENGNVLETIPYSQAGDAAPTILFSQSYPAGHYKLQIQPTALNPNPDVGFGWFVLGTSLPPVNGVQVALSGNCTIQDPASYNVENPDANKAPFMFLIEGVAPEAPEYALLNVSYDELKYDDTQLFSGSVDKSIFALEDKSVLDFEEGTIENITVRGWVRISENVADIAGFGYSIDGGEVVTGDFIQDRAAELANANFPGAQGFCVVVPVADLAAGEHSIDVYVIAADGTQIKVVKDRSTADVEDIRQVGVTFNVTEAAVVPQPTSDIAIVAIAAVACVAAAGVVIGKKKLEK